jgi:uroporphyrin-3 C-methyltransferase
MTNSHKKEEKQQATEQIQDNPTIKSEEQSPAKNTISDHKKFSAIGGIAFFIAIAALGLALYNVQGTNKLQKKLLDDNAQLTAEVNDLKHNQTNSQEQIDTKTDTIQQVQNTTQKKIDLLNKQLQIALHQKFYQNQDWLLLKARYYLELAQINEHWSSDLNTAIALLEQADKLLEQLQSPKVFDLRQAIAKEITQLKTVPLLDIAGILSKLDAAQTQVNNLSIQSAFNENESSITPSAPKTTNVSAWRIRLQESLSLLEKLVVIRRDDENIKPLMSPLFESILKENVRLNLQEAQWAVLNNNDAVYQLALKQAIINLNRTFNKTSQNTTVLIKQLSDLQHIKITQEKPKVELALPLLNQLIETNELLVNPVKNSGKGEN